MDSGTLTLGTLGVGSTLGLLIIAGVGLTSSSKSGSDSGALSASSFVNAVVECLCHSKESTRAFLERVKVARACRIVYLTCLCTWYILRNVVLLLWDVLRMLLGTKQKYHAVYGELNQRNFAKFLRIFKIWEPLPYDLMVGQSSSSLMMPFEDRRSQGLVGVCLRFRYGLLRHRVSGSEQARTLYGRYNSVPAYLPLEEDGSLRVDLIRERFYIEEVELLVPGHWKSYRVTKGDVISPFMLHELVQEFNAVNVVEYEDVFCQHRRRFRQWLRSTMLHYLIRVFCYFSVTFSSALAGALVRWYYRELFPGSLWQCFWLVLVILSSSVVINVFFDYRRRKHGPDTPWHIFPGRYSAYWLNRRIRVRYL